MFYLEEFHDWSHIVCEKELFIVMLEHYYGYLVEKLAGLEVQLSDMYKSNEAHARVYVHNVLSCGQYGYLSEVDKQEKDTYAFSRRTEGKADIKMHFSSLFTPFHFGEYVLEFFQDKRFFKVFGNLKKALRVEKLFIDDFCQAFRIDQLICFLGQSSVSFSHPEVLRQELWMGIVRMHDFSQLYDVIRSLSYGERKVYWGKTIGIQKAVWNMF